MATFDSERLRNVVLLSHSGAGKTTTAEAMLYAAGITSRIGSIEDGTTVSDYEPEEIQRNTSVQTSILPFPWKEHKINVIDTPGYADYRGEVVSGIQVADGALILVSGPAGMEVGTEQMWKMAEERKLPRIILVSKMDRENADFQRVLASLVESFGRRCVAIQIPIGAESEFKGAVNLLDQDADTPDELRQQVEAARERLTEAIAESDDGLANKYLEGAPLSKEEMIGGLRQAVITGTIVPVMVAAATSGTSITELMDAIINLMPSPADTAPPKAKNASNQQDVPLSWKSDGPLVALVFKSSADPFVGKLSYLRVYSGTFGSDSQVLNAGKGELERIGQVLVIRGKSQESVDELAPGDVGALAKLSSVLTGDTLSQRDLPLVLPGIEYPAPVHQMAVYPKSKDDLDKMTSALSRISEEDPCLSVTREPNTLEMLLGGLGDTHLEVAVEKMKRKFGVEIQLQTPKVPYKETIATPIKVEYRHKKQSGGHGQFGHVWLELEPMPRGAGFEFAAKIVGGSVPKEYIPSVEKGVTKALDDGVLAGYPVVDLKATLVDGSFHPVDSSGVSFEIAGNHALSKGLREANPILLEPVMRARITVPESYTGDVMGDLNSKRARILGMTPQDGGTTVIEADVPQAEILLYATELRSQTQGRGTFTSQIDRYEEVPEHLTQRISEAREGAKARS